MRTTKSFQLVSSSTVLITLCHPFFVKFDLQRTKLNWLFEEIPAEFIEYYSMYFQFRTESSG